MQEPIMFMMVGLPASGKSTFAKLLSKEWHCNIHSSDDIRQELFNDINEQRYNNKVFETLHKRVKEDLLLGKSCIYDATNLTYKKRKAFLSELPKSKKVCCIIATPFIECIQRNSKRERKVPEDVMDRMYKSFEVPYWYEGWDDIQIIYSDDLKLKEPFQFISQTLKFNQDNSHHKLTLGEHCREAYFNIFDLIPDNYDINLSLLCSALLHDCGKPYTQTYFNKKGEMGVEAHYYEHHNAGSYEALFYRLPVPAIEVSVRILWHMMPFFWETKKTKEKYKKLWGINLYKDILLLHEADKNAH